MSADVARKPKLEIPASARYKTAEGLASTFYRAQKEVMLSDINNSLLPYFARKYLKFFFDVPQEDVKRALLHGDPWFFIAWRGRLAEVDRTMIETGRAVTDRWSLARAQHMLTLMQMVADKRLVALGGVATHAENNGEAANPTGKND